METPSYDFDVHKLGSFMYNWVSGYMDATFRAIKRVGYDLSGKTLYDIGVGRGRSLAVFRALGVKKVVGIDVNEREFAYARKQSKRLKIDLELRLDSPDNQLLKSLPSESCDAVSIMNLLYCLPSESRKTVLSEARRILKSGGILIIADACQPSLMWLFNSLSLMGRIFSTAKELQQLLSPLKLVAVEPSNHFYFLNKPADFLGRLFGADIYLRSNQMIAVLGVPPSTETFIFQK